MPRPGIGGNGRNGIGESMLWPATCWTRSVNARPRNDQGELLQTMVDREQLSLRQAVALA
jgi:hypothetical protein